MTHGICSTRSTQLKIKKDGTIQTSPVVINRLEDPPTRLKVATTLKKPTSPTHVIIWTDGGYFIDAYMRHSAPMS